MTFAALLTKELRQRLRRERTIWVLIIYLLVMGLLGLLFIGGLWQGGAWQAQDLRTGVINHAPTTLGTQLYTLLAFVQLSLILLITPAFTSTAINGEKERQTFDLLLSSQLSAFALIAGKLVAGLVNACLFIAASIPLFSLVFFFGGVRPDQVISAYLIFVVTAICAGAIGLFCSTLLRRPAASIAITYIFCGMWVLSPWILNSGLLLSPASIGNWQPSLLFIDNPILALLSTGIAVLSAYPLNVAPWISYTVINVLVSSVLMLLSAWLVKPDPIG